MSLSLPYEVSYQITRPLLRAAFWQVFPPKRLAYFLLFTIVVGFLATGGKLDESRMPVLFMLLGPLVLFDVLFVLILLRRYQAYMKLADFVFASPMRLRVDANSISFLGEDYSSTVGWRLIKTVWRRHPKVWLFSTMLNPANRIIVPAEALPSELQRYIEQMVETHGGEVR